MNKSEEILLKNPYKHNGTITSTILKKPSSKFTKKAYIESYGCQMNFSDSEVVASILSSNDYEITSNPEDASLILLNTCSIRDKAEQRIRKRLNDINHLKKNNSKIKIGVLGCMAERVKH